MPQWLYSSGLSAVAVSVTPCAFRARCLRRPQRPVLAGYSWSRGGWRTQSNNGASLLLISRPQTDTQLMASNDQSYQVHDSTSRAADKNAVSMPPADDSRAGDASSAKPWRKTVPDLFKGIAADIQRGREVWLPAMTAAVGQRRYMWIRYMQPTTR
jgi:hypothetical protein